LEMTGPAVALSLPAGKIAADPTAINARLEKSLRLKPFGCVIDFPSMRGKFIWRLISAPNLPPLSAKPDARSSAASATHQISG